MPDLTPSTQWVPSFVEFLHRTTLEGLHSWDLVARTDPLQRILHIRHQRWWKQEEIQVVRQLLKTWCEANDCVYRKSFWEKRDFRALILLKGLGPLSEVNPLLEE